MRWTHDVIVIGAGAAGLTAAGGCARLGLRVALIERDRMGGECLNTGCVPSKALLAAARRAHAMRGGAMGVSSAGATVNFAEVRAYVHGVIAAIAPHDSVERFTAWGVEVVPGDACFTGPRAIRVGDRMLAAPRIVVATGSRPAVPDIPGLAAVPYLTNETVFGLEKLPRHLIVLGAGAMGIEMAQAFRRLGSEVTVLDSGTPLPRHDADAAAAVLGQLVSEGVVLHAGVAAAAVAAVEDGIRVELADGGTVLGSHLLVAAGRWTALDGLGLDAAGIMASPDGIKVDRRRRTSNAHVLAIGDCRAGPRFTHAAGYEGGIAVMAIGFGLPAGVDYAALPSVIHTDPELAQLGLTEAAARRRHKRVRVVQEPFAENDRAVADGAAAGFARVGAGWPACGRRHHRRRRGGGAAAAVEPGDAPEGVGLDDWERRHCLSHTIRHHEGAGLCGLGGCAVRADGAGLGARVGGAALAGRCTPKTTPLFRNAVRGRQPRRQLQQALARQGVNVAVSV